MSGQLLIGDAPELRDRLAAGSGDQPVRLYQHPAGPWPQDATTVLAGVTGARPDLAWLAPGDDLDSGLRLAASLIHEHGIPVILVTTRAAEIAVAALREGVADILEPTATSGEIAAAAARAKLSVGKTSARVNGERRGQVITVASPKGGVGKTTVATNLAVGLAQREPHRTVLVDLDLHFGDVATALNLTPADTLPDLVVAADRDDAIGLKTLLTRHDSGLLVAAGSDSPAAADAVAAAQVLHLLQRLAREFSHVVVDTGPGLSEHTLAALDATDSLVLVTSLDVPGVRGLRKELDTLAELQMTCRRHVVLNFFETSRGLSVPDVEATIRTKVDIVLPQSRLVPVSVNQGVPLVRHVGHDQVTRQLAQLVDLVAPNGAPPARRRLLGKAGRNRDTVA